MMGKDSNSRHQVLVVPTSHLSVGMFTAGTELSSSLFFFFCSSCTCCCLFILCLAWCHFAQHHYCPHFSGTWHFPINKFPEFRKLPPQKVKKILKKILSLHTYLFLLFWVVEKLNKIRVYLWELNKLGILKNVPIIFTTWFFMVNWLKCLQLHSPMAFKTTIFYHCGVSFAAINEFLGIPFSRNVCF